jgi:hypothetical protein
MSRPKALTIALIGAALAFCAGATADGLPARNHRHRVGRSMRVGADHSSDSCHEGETQSLDAHFGRHAHLDLRNESQGDGERVSGKTAIALPVRPPAADPVLYVALLAAQPAQPVPLLRSRGPSRGRAPPSSIR